MTRGCGALAVRWRARGEVCFFGDRQNEIKIEQGWPGFHNSSIHAFSMIVNHEPSSTQKFFCDRKSVHAQGYVVVDLCSTRSLLHRQQYMPVPSCRRAVRSEK